MRRFFKSNTTLRGLLASVAACTLIACGGGGSNNTTAPVTLTPVATAVGGKVLDAAGAPVSGATVSAAGALLTTGSDGSYTFSLDPATTTTVVLVKKTGYSTVAKELPVASGSTTQANLQLFADQVSTTFSGASAASVPVNGATVNFTADSIKLADGGDYTGTVSIGASYYSPDTVQGVQAFAGPYTGIDAGATSSIVTMGFMEVKLTDAAGRPLQLKTGSPATLTFPASSNSANAASVPLWFYDETAQIWKREGTAARQADGTYQGSVAHFTIWNADFFGINATLKGCFRDSAGQPVTNVGFTGLRSTGWSHLFSGRSTDGNFQINLVPAGIPLELYSATSPASFASVAIPALAPGEVRQLPCTTATPGTSNIIVLPTTTFTTTASVSVGTPTVSTTVANNTASFAGVYSGTFSGAEVGTFNVTIDSAGLVSGTGFSQTYNLTVGVRGQISANGSVALTATGSAGSATYSGSIDSAGVISGTWVYVGGSTGGTFTGNRI